MRMRGMLVGLGVLAAALFTSCFANGYCATDADCTPLLQYCDPDGNVCRDESGLSLFEPEDYSASSSSSSSSSSSGGSSSSSSGGSCNGGLTLDATCRIGGSDTIAFGTCRSATASITGLTGGSAICTITPNGRKFLTIKAQDAGTLTVSASVVPIVSGAVSVAVQRFSGGGCDTAAGCSTAGESTSTDVVVAAQEDVRLLVVVNSQATGATLTVTAALH